MLTVGIFTHGRQSVKEINTCSRTVLLHEMNAFVDTATTSLIVAFINRQDYEQAIPYFRTTS